MTLHLLSLGRPDCVERQRALGVAPDLHEQDRAFYLEAWNGHGSFPLDRIGRGHVICDNLCVSILGGTQPDKVRGYIYQARQENDGLLQRFQLLVYPDTAPYAGMVDEYPDAAPLLVEYLSKQPKTFAALALLFHLIDRAAAIQQGQPPGPVSESAARRAQGWCSYLEAHARRIFALGQTLQSQAAGELARRIAAGALDGLEIFTARDIYRKQWSLLDDAEIVAEALNELTEAGWLLRDAQAAGWQHRGYVRYQVNPKARAA